MIVYLTVIRGTKTGRYLARIETEDGQSIAQALDDQEQRAVSKAARQAHAWATDHEWGRITIKRRPQ